MKRLALAAAVFAALVFAANAAPKKSADKTDPASTTEGGDKKDKPAAVLPTLADFAGHYEHAGEGKTVFVLNVRENGANAEADFSAGNTDGSGAAPDGSGTGTVNEKGELVLTVEDSFHNKGTATLRKSGKTFQITVKMDTVAEPRALKFYGVVPLKRVDRGDR